MKTLGRCRDRGLPGVTVAVPGVCNGHAAVLRNLGLLSKADYGATRAGFLGLVPPGGAISHGQVPWYRWSAPATPESSEDRSAVADTRPLSPLAAYLKASPSHSASTVQSLAFESRTARLRHTSPDPGVAPRTSCPRPSTQSRTTDSPLAQAVQNPIKRKATQPAIRCRSSGSPTASPASPTAGRSFASSRLLLYPSALAARLADVPGRWERLPSSVERGCRALPMTAVGDRKMTLG